MMGQVHIFFSAHGVPVAYVEEAGDPYKAEMEECVQLIMAEVKNRGIRCPHTLAYQVICSALVSAWRLHGTYYLHGYVNVILNCFVNEYVTCQVCTVVDHLGTTKF